MSKFKNFIKNFRQEYVIDDHSIGNLAPQLITYHDPSCYIAQQYNSIAGSMLYHPNLKRVQSIVLTSPQPADGKSTTVSNLVISLAQNYNKEILLVDGDWRRPQLGRFFNRKELQRVKPNGSQYREFVYETPVENLQVLLVDNEYSKHNDWLEYIIEHLSDMKSDYDMVLIDSAPILKVVDAAILGREADAVIMLVRAQDTPARLVEQSMETLENNDSPCRAAVLVNHLNSLDVYNYLLNPHYRRYYSNYYSEYSSST